MNQPVRSRRLIAVVAAYVVALQALLLPLSLPIGGMLDASLCAAAQTVANAPSPAGDTSGCPCAAGCGMPCCVHALGGPLQRAIALAVLPSTVAVLATAPGRAVHISERRQPQNPRAPPPA
jgi:hypothetical protein